MAIWMPVGGEFIEADVIRWKEPVFRNRRYGQPARVGDRLVTAEVLSDGGRDGWVDLLVRGGEAVSASLGWNLSDVWLPAIGDETRRRRRSLLKGNPERLAWSDESARDIVASEVQIGRNPAPTVPTDADESDESARAIVASQFLRNPNPAPPVATEPDEYYSVRSSFNAVARLNEIRLPKPGWKLPGLHD
jgi:hypothetical protein